MIALPDTGLRRQTLVGILCAVGASAVFAVNDVAIKFLSGDYARNRPVGTACLIAKLPFKARG